jgi:hypothetical protein
VRQVVFGELAGLDEAIFQTNQCGGGVVAELLAASFGGENRIPDGNVNFRPSPREPVAAIVEAFAAENDDRHDGAGGLRSEEEGPFAHFRAGEDRALAVANSSLGENPNHPPGFEAFDCRAEGLAVVAVAVHRNHIEPSEASLGPFRAEKLGHGDPVDFAREITAEKRGVEMADVVRDHHASAGGNFGKRNDPHACAEAEEVFQRPDNETVEREVECVAGRHRLGG